MQGMTKALKTHHWNAHYTDIRNDYWCICTLREEPGREGVSAAASGAGSVRWCETCMQGL